MAISEIDDLSDDMVASRKYGLMIAGRGLVTIALTLGDKDGESIPADVAREQGALAYGLVSVEEDQGAAQPMVWLFDGTQIDVAVGEANLPPDDDLLEAIGQCLRLFFTDIAPVSPHVAVLKFCMASAANDNTVH